MYHCLTGQSERLALEAIDDKTAVWVKAASYELEDGVQINFYRLLGYVIKCEYDPYDDERRIERIDGGALRDFMVCNGLL